MTPVLLLLLVPSFRTWADETRQRLVWGSLATDGVRLVLEPGSGRKLGLVFRNEGPEPRQFFCYPDGVELVVTVLDSKGEAVPPRVPDPREDTVAVEPRSLALPAGTQATLEVDLEHHVTLPGAGRYRVTIERARLRLEEPRLVSNELVVDLP